MVLRRGVLRMGADRELEALGSVISVTDGLMQSCNEAGSICTRQSSVCDECTGYSHES